MKTIKMLFFAICLVCSNITFAYSQIKHDAPVSESVKKEIGVLLANPDETLGSAKTTELSANVNFMVNEKSEIVILSVYTENPDLEKFIKNRLNYSKVPKEDVVQSEIYKIQVKINFLI